MKKYIFYFIAVIAIGFLLWLNFFRSSSRENFSNVIFTTEAPKPIGPYSQARMNGNALFVSGQIAIEPISGKMDTINIKSETLRVMKNIIAILNAAKMNASDIVKTSIYTTDLGKFNEINEVYAAFFKENPPARETFGVCALPKGAHVEISVIAVR
jgi:2-iminobutanoate/2-iminopropanoate deaminase